MNENITKKDSFLMYKNWTKSIEKLSDEQAGQLLKAICTLQKGEETEPEDIAVSVLFEIIKQKMYEDADAYKAKCDRLLDNFNSQKENEKPQKGKPKSQKGKNNSQKENEKPQKGRVASDSLSLSDTDTDSKDIKESYGENGNVKLTAKEREKLISDYGSDLTEQAIDYLDGYIADKNYKSKSNYQAIRRWVIDAVKEKPRGQPDKFDMDEYLRKRAGL
jgi:hypothetical protein